MRLSEINPLPPYFGRYMELAGDITHMEALAEMKSDLEGAPLDTWESLGDRVYAPGKWTVKSVLQHVLDTERIFLYRALSYARGEKNKVLGFDENEYANNAPVNHRSIKDLITELKHTHDSSIYLFQSFVPEQLNHVCYGFAGEYIVGAIPFILLGHQRWHISILEERYYPLLIP